MYTPPTASGSAHPLPENLLPANAGTTHPHPMSQTLHAWPRTSIALPYPYLRRAGQILRAGTQFPRRLESSCKTPVSVLCPRRAASIPPSKRLSSAHSSFLWSYYSLLSCAPATACVAVVITAQSL